MDDVSIGTLDQAKLLGTLIEGYGKTAAALTARLDQIRQFIAFVQGKTPAADDGKTANSVLLDEARTYKNTTPPQTL